MSDRNYLPQSDEELLEWLKKFSSHLPGLGAQLGITPAEISSLNALILSVKNDIRNGNGKSEEKHLKKGEVLKFVDSLVERMKKHPSYNEQEHGRSFGIS